MGSETHKRSPFMSPGLTSSPSSLAVLHLRRDQLLPIFLRNDEAAHSGYAEGHVTNTRFGSYPHSTLIGVPWGSQVGASQVDTGSRGRREGTKGSSKKRKNKEHETQHGQSKKAKVHDGNDTNQTTEEDQQVSEQTSVKENIPGGEEPVSTSKQPSAASSGFCHIVPPTPESWTVSLPHRTQVVYTPDYSYIIQKMRIRPGAVVIEAGAGSGSFTHAAARAAFNGYPPAEQNRVDGKSSGSSTDRKQKHYGRVYSYEYHASRAEQLRGEISTHGLDSVITVTHRDVYTDGFHLLSSDGTSATTHSPNASHIFFDLPSPWHALPHLTRASPSALDPEKPAHICIFLPCIEQVTQAVSALRKHNWVEISMQQLAHRRIDVRREKVGLEFQGHKGVNAVPASVDEACKRLKEVEMHGRRYQNRLLERKNNAALKMNGVDAAVADETEAGNGQSRLADSEMAERKIAPAEDAVEQKDVNDGKPAFRQGRLVHRTEPEIRNHTSYLIFAVLPRDYE